MNFLGFSVVLAGSSERSEPRLRGTGAREKRFITLKARIPLVKTPFWAGMILPISFATSWGSQNAS
jgi:hypothetical protein